ncbi:MAG TPA: hypothetical protein PK816_07750 [Candidatus Cloacimonadota bacterium]|nr:hypothetical protein [Candidatus Cloacimonadota bacterium]
MNKETKKCPEPMQGSREVTSAVLSGHPSNFPAAGDPSSNNLKYSKFIGVFRPGFLLTHQAPMVLSMRK